MVKCEKQWDAIKPTFARLYHEENKTLDEVRCELAANYQFKASKSAWTKQIKKWGAFKNYKASDKQDLLSQRMNGKQPKLDPQGRPIKWDRVHRATRGQIMHNRDQNPSRRTSYTTEFSKTLVPVAQPLPQPVDHDSRVLSFVVDIWHQSTLQFASKDPSASSYHVEHSLYHQLMQSTKAVAQPDKLRWPKREVDYICNAIPTLVRAQPAMMCDLLAILITDRSSHAVAEQNMLKDQVFNYIRSAALVLLPEGNPFRSFISRLHNRQALATLGPLLSKAKLDTMWNTGKSHEAGLLQARPFFRQVLLGAVFVLLEYKELQSASAFLDKLADHDLHDASYQAARARLAEKDMLGESG